MFLTNTNGGTAEILSSIITKLYKQWCVPFAAGADASQLGDFDLTPFQGANYEESLGLERHNKTGFDANPFMVTSERIDGVEQIVIYGLNLKVPPQSVTGSDLNPTLGGNGDDTIFRAKGGDPETLQGGTTWTLVNADGFVKDEDDAEIKDTLIFTDDTEDNEEVKFPMPLVLFGRSDMS